MNDAIRSKNSRTMAISVEYFINLVTIRARAAFMIALGEKVIYTLKKEDPHLFSLSRGLLDISWSWEESLSASPLEIYEYLDSSDEDFAKAEDLSLACQFEGKPEPLQTAILTIVNAGCIVTKYAYQIMENDKMPPVIVAESSEEVIIPAVAEGVIEMKLVDKAWIERAISYLMSNYESDDPNALGEPIKREELMSLA